MRKLAIIPARGGSKRLPRKNIKNFMGQPVIGYPIRAAFQSKLFDEVMISTDDDEIADIGKLMGASIPFYRSGENSSDVATTVDVLLEVIEYYQKKGIRFSHACCIYPTSPLLSVYDLRAAYNKMIQQNFDTVVPVTKFSYPIQRSLSLDPGKRLQMALPEFKNTRTQDLADSYHDAGQFYWFDVKKMQKNKSLFTGNTGAIILPEQNVQDIDTEDDWKLAEMKYKLLNPYHEISTI